MSPTPFLGLSVMIHLGIIFVNRILGRNDPTKRKPPRTNGSPASRGISLAIITSVFTVVTASAALLVDTAVADKYSSIRFINRIITQDLIREPTNNSDSIYSNNIYSTLNYTL